MKKMCSQRKEELSQNKVQMDQFGSWLKADARKKEWVGSKINNARKETTVQEGTTIGSIKEFEGKKGGLTKRWLRDYCILGMRVVGEREGNLGGRYVADERSELWEQWEEG